MLAIQAQYFTSSLFKSPFPTTNLVSLTIVLYSSQRYFIVILDITPIKQVEVDRIIIKQHNKENRHNIIRGNTTVILLPAPILIQDYIIIADQHKQYIVIQYTILPTAHNY